MINVCQVFDKNHFDVALCLIESGQVRVLCGSGKEETLKEGAVLLSVDALLCGVRGQVRTFVWPSDWPDSEPARVQVPAEGSLQFPATVYTLPSHTLKEVFDKHTAAHTSARAAVVSFAVQVLQYQQHLVEVRDVSVEGDRSPSPTNRAFEGDRSPSPSSRGFEEEDFGSPVNSVAPERLENISEVDSFGQERSEDAEPAELHRGQRSPMGVYHKRSQALDRIRRAVFAVIATRRMMAILNSYNSQQAAASYNGPTSTVDEGDTAQEAVGSGSQQLPPPLQSPQSANREGDDEEEEEAVHPHRGDAGSPSRPANAITGVRYVTSPAHTAAGGGGDGSGTREHQRLPRGAVAAAASGPEAAGGGTARPSLVPPGPVLPTDGSSPSSPERSPLAGCQDARSTGQRLGSGQSRSWSEEDGSNAVDALPVSDPFFAPDSGSGGGGERARGSMGSGDEGRAGDNVAGESGSGGAAALLAALRSCDGLVKIDEEEDGGLVQMRTHAVRWQDCGLRGRLLWAPPRAKGHRNSVVGSDDETAAAAAALVRGGKVSDVRGRALSKKSGHWSKFASKRRGGVDAAAEAAATAFSRYADGEPVRTLCCRRCIHKHSPLRSFFIFLKY